MIAAWKDGCRDGWRMDVTWKDGCRDGWWMDARMYVQNMAHSKHPKLLEIVKVCHISKSREKEKR